MLVFLDWDRLINDKIWGGTICISVPPLQILGGGRVPPVIYAHGYIYYNHWYVIKPNIAVTTSLTFSVVLAHFHNHRKNNTSENNKLQKHKR